MSKQKNIAILGSTGSIGTQTLDVIEEYPDMLKAYLLTANNSADLLIEQALKFRPKKVVIANEAHYGKVKEALAATGIEVATGTKAIVEAVADEGIDMVVTALVGYSGLEPTINAIKAGKTIALANKETLVVGGELITRLLKSSKSEMIPVDSEHSAIFQCLVGESHDSISKLILTASGGPFRTLTKEEMAHVTKADALHHPNWKMGAKVTIDSASMMNKGFEMIEARWLFDVQPENIEIVVHPQSVVHSMVEFVDGSVKAQWALHDMRLPIRYALNYPERLPSRCDKLKVAHYSQLTFESPDTDKFPMLAMAFEAIRQGGNVPCALNAANEIAVAAFLGERIRFIDIPRIVESAVARNNYIHIPSYEDFVATNKEIREIASSLI